MNEDLKAKPLSLGDLIEVAADSVVSKTLLKKETGNLTLFAFDSGQGLSEHTSPFDAVVQVVEGAARLTIGGDDLSVATGQMVIMPAGVPHAVHADEPFKMLLTMIRSQ
jgi:quercetin dioxygenase-like cupin family protein